MDYIIFTHMAYIEHRNIKLSNILWSINKSGKLRFIISDFDMGTYQRLVMESLPQATEQQLFAMCQLASASQIWWTSLAFISTGPGVMVVIQLVTLPCSCNLHSMLNHSFLTILVLLLWCVTCAFWYTRA